MRSCIFWFILLLELILSFSFDFGVYFKIQVDLGLNSFQMINPQTMSLH